MNVIDKLYEEWAWRSESGTPNFNNPADRKILEEIVGQPIQATQVVLEEEEATQVSVEDVIGLVKQNSDNQKLLTRVYRTLSSAPSIQTVKSILDKAGVDKDTFENRNLHNELINILLKGDKADVSSFITSIKGNTFSPNESGNLFNYIPNLPKEKVSQIANLTGAKGSVAMGKGEVLFPLLFPNIQLLRDGKGDFTVDGRAAELKATGARLSGDRTDIAYKPINDVPKTWKASLLGDIKMGQVNNNLDKVFDNINNFVKQVYPKTPLRITNQNRDEIRQGENIIKFMTIAAVDSYIKEKQIETYILLDKKSLNFRAFTPATDLLDALKRGDVKVAIKTNPQLSSFKVN